MVYGFPKYTGAFKNQPVKKIYWALFTHSLLCSRSPLLWVCGSDGVQPRESYRVSDVSISPMSVWVLISQFITIILNWAYNHNLRNPFGSVFTPNNLKPSINPKMYKLRKGNDSNKSGTWGNQHEGWNQLKEDGARIPWARDRACVANFGEVLEDLKRPTGDKQMPQC